MNLGSLVTALSVDESARRVLDHARAGETLVDIAVAGGARPALVAALAENQAGPEPIVLVAATGREAEDLTTALRCFLPPETVAHIPSWETLPHERLSPRSDTVGRRLAVLRRLAHPDPSDPLYGPIRVLVSPVRALLQPIATGLADLEPVALHTGDSRPLPEVVEALAAAAYIRTDLVERRGEFAVRGGILDVFPPTENHPLRVEFFGDEVEEIRVFKVADQRSLEIAPHGLWAPPCREILLTDAVRARAEELIPRLPGVADMLGKIAAGVAVEGMESLGPVLVDGMESLLDLLPPEAKVVVSDPERVRARAHDLVATSQEFLEASWSGAAAGAVVPVDLASVLGEGSFWSLARAREHALHRGLAWWTFTSFASDEELVEDIGADDAVAVNLVSQDASAYRGDPEAIRSDLKRWALQEKQQVVVVTEGPGLGKRLAEVLAEDAVPALSCSEERSPAPVPGTVLFVQGCLTRGFVVPGADLVVVTETDLVGQNSSGGGGSTRDMRKMPSRRRNQVDPLQLRPGDFVVHEQHGVGRFVEMTQRTVQGATREYLVLEYASSKRGQPGDRLFVPTDQLDQVTRYVGGEAPSLNKLGGSDWSKTKSRAKKYVKEIAGELIRLYSARMATRGHAFSPDTPWQRELEEAFAYIETPDQLSSIDEVKADMEKEVPMDRLICGDVGYGKTEIAVRAAFKAIQDGKQVAVLVPTTLLVQQHLVTFSERYAQFPVRVRALSRFQTESETKAVMEGLQDGSVDLVIGTHRLLSPQIRFKSLGLVVIDEEQRFGVEHKEQLKALRTDVDVLAMSATPIPRTLEMAVTGIREMSTLTTPPEERHPVLTFVGAYDEKQVTAAIRRELLREGQVFFVHNRVQSIEKTAARLRELVPEARIGTAHGKMGESRLEQVVVDFWERRFDVLVCTTIVETGLDVSNANTLIVDRADVLGLSQLHQLRGRVGRGRERAYSYFLYPAGQTLTETAHDRLATIAGHTDLGAGMAVAMKDLEIRGAGNLLGGEQSGHIAGVGFDLYVRLVGEAVADFRDPDRVEQPPEIKIELPVDAHLPHEYVPGERLRLEAYRKLAQVSDEAELAEIVAELVDRYGPLPPPAENLVEVARLRTVARAAGISDIGVQGRQIRFGPVDLPDSRLMRLQRLYKGTVVKAALRTILVPSPATAPVGGRPLRDKAVLDWAAQLVRTVLLDDLTRAGNPTGKSR
ncbi:transcription-repair coupling factor [Austwickia chelonae]|uniref:Transcription-repair-coupling factor n=1 Tax=Austwickia chelonae NBRC 105200 TaxID=1184607 RepID=K6VRR5_9MICO|nr:transcription-repair coupling factor [Austwickia chelonae]GAB78010.1 transcription-repair-coupling factor [Austwickia chelonae NBRC 105200]SEV94256.1 transcription-repair coupling factor [Austwickia chelonae]